MKFYRRLTTFSIISFDLDDTLYDNQPIIQHAEQQLLQQINGFCSVNTSLADWRKLKSEVLQQQPALRHDVTAWRKATLQLGLARLKPQQDTSQFVEQALDFFIAIRSQITIAPAVEQLLIQLGQRWPLVAISNGNIDPKIAGLDQFFSTCYFAGNGHKQKPDNTLFHLAAKRHHVAPAHIMHIGDSYRADVIGAKKAGCQAIWLNNSPIEVSRAMLPDAEINDVLELRALLQ